MTDRAVGLACLVLGVVISVGVLRHDPVLAGITVAVAFGYTWLIWRSQPIWMAAAFFITLPIWIAAYVLCDILPGDWTWNLFHESHESGFALVLFAYTFFEAWDFGRVQFRLSGGGQRFLNRVPCTV